MGALFYVLAIPTLSLAFVAWAVATRHLSDGLRRATMVAAIFLGCGVWALVRTGGFNTNFDNDFAWRWAETPEERLLAQDKDEPSPPPPLPPAPAQAPEEPKAEASAAPAVVSPAPVAP